MGYGSQKITARNLGKMNRLAGLRICGQVKDDGVHNLSALVDCSKAVLLVAIP